MYIVKSANFRIWLKADYEARAKRTSLRDQISLDNAREILGKRQKIERAELSKIYNFDLLKQEEIADLVINTSHLSSDEVVYKIMEKLEERMP